MRRYFRRRFWRTAVIAAVVAFAFLAAAGAALAQSPGASTSTPDLTDDLGSWAALVGIGLPALVALIQRDHFPDWVNAVIFGVAVVVASVVYGWIKFGSDFTWAHWQGTLLAIVVWGIATYKLYWNPGTQSVVRKLRALPKTNR